MRNNAFTEKQMRQIEFLERLEPYESLIHLREYHCDCHTCGESKVFHAACSAISFISRHRGHNTWVKVI